MITCSRCGKENQDHYKFCLGCGAKLEVSAKAEMRKPAEEQRPAAPLEAAKTAPPPQKTPERAPERTPPPQGTPAARPAPLARPAGSGLGKAPPRPAAATSPATDPAAGRSDIPASRASGVINTATGKSTPARRMTPAPLPAGGSMSASPLPGLTPQNQARASVQPRPATPPPAAPPPVAPSLSPSAPVAPLESLPPAAFVPTTGSDSGFITVGAAAPVGAAVAAPPEMVACPQCGKPVAATYTFCGACGYRMKTPPGAASAVAKTMLVPPPAKPVAHGLLTLIRPDGTEGGNHALVEGENLIGRGQGSLFDADPYLSPRHAEFVLSDEGLVVHDLRSLNGVFVRLTEEEALESGDIFRIGQELLRFDVISAPTPLEDGTEIVGTPNPGYWGRISVIVGRDADGPAFPLFDETVVLGRERGDILFPEDGYVSGAHAQIVLRNGQVFLSDLGSSNGTFFRIRNSLTLNQGMLLLMGQQLFRINFG